MEALASAGDRAGALRHARVHETMLHEQLGLTAGPAVAALAARLREPGGAVADSGGPWPPSARGVPLRGAAATPHRDAARRRAAPASARSRRPSQAVDRPAPRPADAHRRRDAARRRR